MNHSGANKRIVYFFSSFPVLSETFLQREVRGLLKLGMNLELVSLWQGESEFEGTSVTRFRLRQLWQLLWKLPWVLLRRPRLTIRLLRMAFFSRYPYTLNWHENLLGIGAAICLESHYRKQPVAEFHAVWGSLPAMTAWALSELLHIPFSMAAHAYDIFERGGDRWLKEKIQAASWVQTSTEYAYRHLLEKGASSEKTFLIRRSLEPFPVFTPRAQLRKPLRMVSVGRLVEKKGYREQLDIYSALQQSGIDFHATIIGGGPMEQEIRQRILDLELSDRVTLTGSIAFEQTMGYYRDADIMIFTGKIAADGDRDGLPNVIPEAMACGLVILTSAVSATTEAVQDRLSGRILPLDQPQQWVAAVRELLEHPDLVAAFSLAGRQWAEKEFDPQRNATKLAQLYHNHQ
jgi:colanic acid/amylovoran biosynthesis glycosyltransferase